MSDLNRVIDALADDLVPLRPLRPPLARAAGSILLIGAAGWALVAWRGDVAGLVARYSGRESAMAAEMIAMSMTAVAALVAAFMLSVPGRAKAWRLAPLPPLLVWALLSGIGCLQDLARLGTAAWAVGHGGHCFLFLIAAGAAIGLPLLWLLSRARPIEPLAVATLGGLAAAATAALLLQFFHPFAFGPIDLAGHAAATALLVAIPALLRRRLLGAA